MKVLSFILFTLFANPFDMETIENSTFHLSGIVVEESTGEPLTGAVIKIQGVENEYFTDFEGYFSINEFKPGTYDIEISYISFNSKELKEIYLDHKNSDIFVSLR